MKYPTETEIDAALERVAKRSTHIAWADYRDKRYERDIDFTGSPSIRAAMKRRLAEPLKQSWFMRLIFRGE